jgi:small subunit ribosomal protein S15Ae
MFIPLAMIARCLFDRNNYTIFETKLIFVRLAGYIGEFEEVDDHRSGKVVIQLNGRLNKTGVISPRYNVALRDLEKWVVKLLPSRQFGYIVLTTSAGIMDHEEARRKHVAGKIIGFFY